MLKVLYLGGLCRSESSFFHNTHSVAGTVVPDSAVFPETCCLNYVFLLPDYRSPHVLVLKLLFHLPQGVFPAHTEGAEHYKHWQWPHTILVNLSFCLTHGLSFLLLSFASFSYGLWVSGHGKVLAEWLLHVHCHCLPIPILL